MSQTSSIRLKILDFIKQKELFQRGDKVVVAVSGGPDSVCLLHVLAQLMSELGIHLHIAHMDHMLRGDESAADAQYVASLARKLNVAYFIEKRDVLEFQARYRCPVEEAAREARYSFLAEACQATGAACAAVGHNANDQIETILLHLIRGTGLAGLRGMQPRTVWRSHYTSHELTIVRPLLGIHRAETVHYCKYQGLETRVDSSNLSSAYLRNRVRYELLPLLNSYNPGIDSALLRTADAVTDDLDFVMAKASKLWHRAVSKESAGFVIDIKAVAEAPLSLQRHLFREVLKRLLGNLMDIEARHIDCLLSALNKPAGKMFSLPHSVVASVGYGTLWVGLESAAPCPLPLLEGEHRLNIPGITNLGGWLVTADKATSKSSDSQGQDWRSYFDFDATGDELMVRGRKPGDRFVPLGMDKPKKLQDFMVDAKIPRSWRDRVPIVCSPKHTIWVAGWRIDDRVKVTDATKRILSLKFEEKVDP